jgi:hypothetical protein
MKVTRIFPDASGETHFEDVQFPLESVHNGLFKRSKPIKASEMTLTSFGSSLDEPIHNAPRKQAIVIINGEVELSVSDGQRRRFGPGHMLILEDTTGKGHTTRSIGDRERDEVWVALE